MNKIWSNDVIISLKLWENREGAFKGTRSKFFRISPLFMLFLKKINRKKCLGSNIVLRKVQLIFLIWRKHLGNSQKNSKFWQLENRKGKVFVKFFHGGDYLKWCPTFHLYYLAQIISIRGRGKAFWKFHYVWLGISSSWLQKKKMSHDVEAAMMWKCKISKFHRFWLIERFTSLSCGVSTVHIVLITETNPSSTKYQSVWPGWPNKKLTSTMK